MCSSETPAVRFNQRWFSEPNQCKCETAFKQPHLITRHVVERAHLSSYELKLRKPLRCASVCVCVYPRRWAAVSSINLEPEWFFAADVLLKFPLFYSKLSLPQSEVIWVQLCGGKPSKTWRCLLVSLSLCAQCLAGRGMGHLLQN